MSTPRLTELVEKMKDRFTGFLTQISGDHRYIHDGRAFSYASNTGSVSASASYSLAFKTPSADTGKYIHLRPTKYTATANTTSITIREGDTYTGGSAGTPINRNRNSSNTSSVTLTYGVTAGGAGTVVFQDVIGGGANPAQNMGGGGGAAEELVLKPATTYTIIFTVVGATTASTAYFELFWYEEAAG